ncbi:11150_t:CDS:2 [Rhizophagus irregularis]|nr:11150_t:CDS:2 [Rhizophagus irregularis]
MKIVLNRLREENTLDCNYFTPKYYFETEWCLDMHGYLDREELDIRLEEINRVVAENPLLSDRAKKGFIAPFAIEGINAIAFFVGRYLVNEEAKRRSERFSEAIKKLFDQYNVSDNPTANWKLKWRNVLSHYKVEMNYSLDNNGVKAKGKITPKYAEEAEIELEINDALADVTECTIRLQLCRNNKLRRINKQKEELERLLSSNEDYSVIIDDRKLPKTPPSNYIPPSNNKPRPDNTPPFNNTPRPDNTPPFNNTPRPDNTLPIVNTPNRPDNTLPLNNIPQPDYIPQYKNSPPPSFNNTPPSNNTEIPKPSMNMRTATSVPYNPQMSSTYTV